MERRNQDGTEKSRASLWMRGFEILIFAAVLVAFSWTAVVITQKYPILISITILGIIGLAVVPYVLGIVRDKLTAWWNSR